MDNPQNVYTPKGAAIFGTPLGWLIILAILGLSFVLIHFIGLIGGMLLLGLPVGLVVVSYIWNRPKIGVWGTLIMAFFSAGITRYVPGPWGLTVDILLALSWLSIILNKSIKPNWKHAKNPIVALTSFWMLFLTLEIVNPSGNGLIAWFYAMRGIGFYQALTVPLVFLFFRKQKDMNQFFNALILFSLIGTVWGFKQQILGVDAAEHHWLYAENHHEEHVLHGVLRVFSFYSDAGSFGSSQAMMALMCGILFMGPYPTAKKIKYLVLAIVFLLGFAISGTRGALAVPLAGGIAYLILIKNFKILIAGFSAMIIVFVILKYTFLFQGVEQVRRMRTALDPNNKSLSVRLENQKTFARYLATRPFGGGIGTAGFWGARFNPDSLMANTATDSWFVKIWAETGPIGLMVHLVVLGFILGYGGLKIMRMRCLKNRTQASALYAMLAGAIFASYGNQVLIQMPTGIILNFAIPFIFLIAERDTKTWLKGIKKPSKLRELLQ
ncbi:O-antigen ligase family protein [Roseivirga thermotolerans]|uniref:O-antigen ligase-related domain-containing protein n=1 Tax=Roseivirga thermotolerans TaxID=1758176 RepID=A0ABQ3IC23_9BACT|nr:O-antigen ligase family protein [Roseivirga thermotolerans]GHE73383.1 hypothetical protein GCM10011340_32460 [Roseivirga thermotolerans]